MLLFALAGGLAVAQDPGPGEWERVRIGCIEEQRALWSRYRQASSAGDDIAAAAALAGMSLLPFRAPLPFEAEPASAADLAARARELLLQAHGRRVANNRERVRGRFGERCASCGGLGVERCLKCDGRGGPAGSGRRGDCEPWTACAVCEGSGRLGAEAQTASALNAEWSRIAGVALGGDPVRALRDTLSGAALDMLAAAQPASAGGCPLRGSLGPAPFDLSNLPARTRSGLRDAWQAAALFERRRFLCGVAAEFAHLDGQLKYLDAMEKAKPQRSMIESAVQLSLAELELRAGAYGGRVVEVVVSGLPPDPAWLDVWSTPLSGRLRVEGADARLLSFWCLTPGDQTFLRDMARCGVGRHRDEAYRTYPFATLAKRIVGIGPSVPIRLTGTVREIPGDGPLYGLEIWAAEEAAEGGAIR